MNGPNFSDELHQATKSSDQHVCMWLQDVSITILQQRDTKYYHNFLLSQQAVYTLLFGRDNQNGILWNVYNRVHQYSKLPSMKQKFLDEFILLYQFIQQLTPKLLENQPNFYDLLMWNQNQDSLSLSPISMHLLPPHLQILLSDQSNPQMNPHLTAFFDLFRENLFANTQQVVSPSPSSSMLKTPSGKYSVIGQKLSGSSIIKRVSQINKPTVMQSYAYELKVESMLTMWIYLLSSLKSFRHQTIIANNEIFSTLQDSLGVKFPISESTFMGLIQNPALVIMRRILSHLCTAIDEATQFDTKSLEKPQLLLSLVQKMIVLAQEFTLYNTLFQINPNELKLSPLQAQHFLRLRYPPYVIDSHLQATFLIIALNSQYGSRIDQIFQQFFQIYHSSNPIFKSSISPQKQTYHQSQGHNQKQFFFSCGRNPNHITFAQALYRLLSFGLQSYSLDKQSNSALSLQSYISLLVLFARWPMAQYETQFLSCAQVFDIAMSQFSEKILKSQREVNNAFSRYRLNFWDKIAYIYNSVFWKTVNKFRSINHLYKLQLLKSVRIDFKLIKQQLMDNKRKDLINPFVFHFIELKDKSIELSNHVQYFYPFFTLLLNQIIIQIGRQNRITPEEAAAIVSLLSFVCLSDSNMNINECIQRVQTQLYGGAIQLKSKDSFYAQYPSHQDLKSFCESLESISDPQYTHSNHLYQIFGNETVKIDAKKLTENLQITYEENFKSKNQPLQVWLKLIPETIALLESIYQFKMEKDSVQKRQKFQEQQKNSRILQPNYQTENNWLIPPKDNEIMFLLYLMRKFSFCLDLLLMKPAFVVEGRTEKQIQPCTQWPRIFANVDNLQIIFIISLLIYGIGHLISLISSILQ